MTRILAALAVILLVGYGLFEARRLIEGPELVLTSPQPGTATSSSLITVSGTASNISFLTINDAPARTDEQGRFSETLTLPAGYTVVTLAATDRFGRRASASAAVTVLDYCPV